METTGRRRLQAVRESIAELPHCDIESTQVPVEDLWSKGRRKNNFLEVPVVSL